jgi:hypothetical protein
LADAESAANYKQEPPRNCESSEAANVEARIGESVLQLMMWGFPKAEACTAVGDAARGILQPTEHLSSLRFGAERIEQIYEGWRLAAGIKLTRWKYSKEWLRAAAPAGSVTDLARRLLRGETFPNFKETGEDLWGGQELVVTTDYTISSDSCATPPTQKRQE